MRHCFRLRRGEDLYEAIQAYARAHDIAAAVPLCCVGCVSRWRMRTADGVTVAEAQERAEIVSLTGTVSVHGSHLHISLAREDLSVIGGHLTPGCIVNTTAEVVLEALPEVVFMRVLDPTTGYKELKIKTEK